MPSSSRGSFQPRDRTQLTCIAGGFFAVWATREAWVILSQYSYCTHFASVKTKALRGRLPQSHNKWGTRQCDQSMTTILFCLTIVGAGWMLRFGRVQFCYLWHGKLLLTQIFGGQNEKYICKPFDTVKHCRTGWCCQETLCASAGTFPSGWSAL